VVGAARGERKLAAVRAQGAVAAIDYSGRDWPGRVLAAQEGDRRLRDVLAQAAAGWVAPVIGR
jgi:hypothetical protein